MSLGGMHGVSPSSSPRLLDPRQFPVLRFVCTRLHPPEGPKHFSSGSAPKPRPSSCDCLKKSQPGTPRKMAAFEGELPHGSRYPLAPIQKPAPQNDADHPHLPLERLGLRRRAHLLHRSTARSAPPAIRRSPSASSSTNSPSGSRASSSSPPPSPNSLKTVSPGASSKRSRPTPLACSCPSSSAKKAATAACRSKPTRATIATAKRCLPRPSTSASSRPT